MDKGQPKICNNEKKLKHITEFEAYATLSL